jgi:hypothetical protein
MVPLSGQYHLDGHSLFYDKLFTTLLFQATVFLILLALSRLLLKPWAQWHKEAMTFGIILADNIGRKI